jgi:hypothetical protein
MVALCPPGSHCVGGDIIQCSAGTYRDSTGGRAAQDCRQCYAGAYCRTCFKQLLRVVLNTGVCIALHHECTFCRDPTATGTATPLPCGNSSLYCPVGSEAPVVVGAGYYSVGVVGSSVKFGRELCSVGQYCPGDGVAYDCPSGRYGNSIGLSDWTCSGQCGDGLLCAPRSTSNSELCPTGQFCVKGISMPCPAGSYNPTPGATNASACLLCPENTYSARNGSSSASDCQLCPDFEGSAPGAVACWPGVKGADGCRD